MRLRSASPCEASKLASPKKARQEFRSIPVDSLVRDTGGGGGASAMTRQGQSRTQIRRARSYRENRLQKSVVMLSRSAGSNS